MTRRPARRATAFAVVAMAVAVVATANAAPPQPAAAGPMFRYVTRPGDNLYTLADAYLIRLQDYRIVQRLNHVRNPYRLPIGRMLSIPRALLRTVPLTGRVVAFRGDAIADGRPVRIGTRIGEGGRIQTGANAFLTMALDDGSKISIPSQTQISVERLQRVLISGELERLFRLEAGRTETEVTPRRNPTDRFEIRTPLSVAAVRGTHFRVAVSDDGKAATAGVIHGQVAVTSKESEIRLEPGQGARTTAAGTEPTVPLLPEPSLLRPGRLQADSDLSFAIADVTGAAQYRFQIATDAGFMDLVEETTGTTAAATLPAVPNGNYFVRATAIDANGIEGLPHIYSFERYLNFVRTSVDPLPGRRRYRFRWQVAGDGKHHFRFVLAPAANPGQPVIDEPALETEELVITDLTPGTYVWRVMTTSTDGYAVRSNWSPAQTLTVTRSTRAR